MNQAVQEHLAVSQPRHIDGQRANFPDPPTQDDVWAWLVQFQDDFLLEAPATYHSAQRTSSTTGGDSQRQLDIFLKPKHVKNPKHDWKDIRHLLASDRRVRGATHNMTAWRIRGAGGATFQDCDDDGETAAGGRLLHLMQLMDLWDTVVVVTRW
ncbi:hypothetical protein B0T24DRAFT_596595 [Lasiosphaeria ovina]|uniref:Impact N-terminal domain-containing protein n=1 Tax=Lasiosphaeria ovina TaxID=92902 RepID=A0AAE0JYG9_9PEZI|nr:hypothetical protein B0T24DRAFT_596595 [Lasiosphaeria ovina]